MNHFVLTKTWALGKDHVRYDENFMLGIDLEFSLGGRISTNPCLTCVTARFWKCCRFSCKPCTVQRIWPTTGIAEIQLRSIKINLSLLATLSIPSIISHHFQVFSSSNLIPISILSIRKVTALPGPGHVQYKRCWSCGFGIAGTDDPRTSDGRAPDIRPSSVLTQCLFWWYQLKQY